MKSTISESKILIKKIKEAKDKLTTTQKNHVDYTFQSPELEHVNPSEISTPLTVISKMTNQMSKKSTKPKIDFIRENIVGLCTRYISPYNIELETVYIDHTATNRAYTPV